MEHERDEEATYMAERTRKLRLAMRLSWAAVVLNAFGMVLALKANGYLF